MKKKITIITTKCKVYYTDGCSDDVELVNYYCDENGLDPDTDSDDVWDLFSTNEKVYSKILKKYINQFYSI